MTAYNDLLANLEALTAGTPRQVPQEVSTLIRRILSGSMFPSHRSLTRILQELDPPPGRADRILQLRTRAFEERQADRATHRAVVRRSDVPQFGQPDPLRVSTIGELIDALNAVRIWAGSPSLRKLEARSNGRLKRSSVSDMLSTEVLPNYDRFIAFLRACGIEGSHIDVWVFTWRRLKALEHPEAARWMPGYLRAVAM